MSPSFPAPPHDHTPHHSLPAMQSPVERPQPWRPSSSAPLLPGTVWLLGGSPSYSSPHGHCQTLTRTQPPRGLLRNQPRGDQRGAQKARSPERPGGGHQADRVAGSGGASASEPDTPPPQRWPRCAPLSRPPGATVRLGGTISVLAQGHQADSSAWGRPWSLRPLYDPPKAADLPPRKGPQRQPLPSARGRGRRLGWGSWAADPPLDAWATGLCSLCWTVRGGSGALGRTLGGGASGTGLGRGEGRARGRHRPGDQAPGG